MDAFTVSGDVASTGEHSVGSGRVTANAPGTSQPPGTSAATQHAGAREPATHYFLTIMLGIKEKRGSIRAQKGTLYQAKGHICFPHWALFVPALHEKSSYWSVTASRKGRSGLCRGEQIFGYLGLEGHWSSVLERSEGLEIIGRGWGQKLAPVCMEKYPQQR